MPARTCGAGAAATVFTIAAHQDPDDPEPWLVLALYLRFLRDLPAALGLAGIALTLRPLNQGIRRHLAVLDESWALPGEKGENDIEDEENKEREESEASTEDCRWAPRERWIAAWSSVMAPDPWSTDEPEVLEKALHEIEAVRADSSAYLPELTYASRLTGLLHRRLAELLPASDAQRAELLRAVENLEDAVRTGLPGGVAVPPLWRVELGDALAELGDSLTRSGRSDQAAPFYRQACDNYTEVVNTKPISLLTGFRRKTVLSGEQPHLPTRARAFAGRAQARVPQGRSADAVNDCHEALRLAPLYAYPRFTLACVFRDWGQYESAVEHLRRLIEIDPLVGDEVRLELARTYRRHAETTGSDRREELLGQALEQLIAIGNEASPHQAIDAEVQDEIADLFHLMGRTDYEIFTLRTTADITGQQGDGRRYARLAGLLARRARPEEVERMLLKAQAACAESLHCSLGTDAEQRLEGEGVELAVRLAMFYAEQGIKLGEARRIVEGAWDRARGTRQQAMCMDARGWVAFHDGRYADAIDYLQDALRYSGGEAQQWAHLAQAWEARAAVPFPHHGLHWRSRDLDQARKKRKKWQKIVQQFDGRGPGRGPGRRASPQARRQVPLVIGWAFRSFPVFRRADGAISTTALGQAVTLCYHQTFARS
ncbi:hypothetical protein ACFQ6V_00470 [Streptomyces roseifaciens]